MRALASVGKHFNHSEARMNSRTLLAWGAVLLLTGSWPVLTAWAAEEPHAAQAAADDRININTATEAELAKLRGIGPSVAKRIIEYRQAHGDFKKPEDIRKVSGVGKGLWEQNRDRIAVK